MDSQKAGRNEPLLTSVAESIGATLGTIAAKADAVQKVFTKKLSAAKPQRAGKSRVRKASATRRKRGARPNSARRAPRRPAKLKP